MRSKRHDTGGDTRTLLQFDEIGMDALERDKDKAYLQKVQGVVNFWWETLLGRQ